jgi:hypothetical protein
MDEVDLNAIEARARHSLKWGDDAHCDTLLALVAEVRRLRAERKRLLLALDDAQRSDRRA